MNLLSTILDVAGLKSSLVKLGIGAGVLAVVVAGSFWVEHVIEQKGFDRGWAQRDAKAIADQAAIIKANNQAIAAATKEFNAEVDDLNTEKGNLDAQLQALDAAAAADPGAAHIGLPIGSVLRLDSITVSRRKH